MKLFQVDAFTNVPFKGNPAGVHISTRPLDAVLMQQIAAEVNVAETAFVYEQDQEYIIRFFTPTQEVPICGHATLSAAHIMYETALVPKDASIRFHAQSGPLSVTKENDWYVLDFPIYTSEKVDHLLSFQQKTEILAQEVYRSSNGWYIALLDNERAVQEFIPNLSLIKEFNVTLILITAKGSGDFDYVMRLFAPSVGIDEDPVTGSAECVLAPIWQQKLGKDSFLVKQLSQRTGIKKVKLQGERVLISGQGITMFEMELKGF